MKKNINRIENRIVLILSLLSVLGIIFSFISFRSSVEKLEIDNLQETLRMNANHKLNDMNLLINEMVDDLEQTADKIIKYNDIWHPDVKWILELSNDMNWYNYTGVVDKNGKGYDNSGNIVDISDREYFHSAMEGHVAFSEVIDSNVVEGDRVQIIAHPLRTKDKEVVGIVFGVMNMENYQEMIKNNDSTGESTLFIVDSCGSYIGKFQENNDSSAENNFWSDLENSHMDEELFADIRADFEERKVGEFSYTNSNGNRYYACYMPIGPNKWQLIYSIAESSTDKVVKSLYKLDSKNTIFATVCYLLLILCIIWYFKQSENKIKRAHQEAKKNMEYMYIAMAYSKNIVFEYNQCEGSIQLKTNTANLLFDRANISHVPESITMRGIIAPKSVPAFEKLFETIKTKRSCEDDIQIIKGDEKIWYRISMNNIYDERDVITDTVGIVVDITEQKCKEEEMVRKLQIQDTLISNALIYAKADMATDILLELNGKEVCFPFENFIHENVNKYVKEEQADYIEQKLSLKNIMKVYKKGREELEIQFLMKIDGDFKWVSCAVYCKESIAIFIITDIDERKRREIELKSRAERDGLTGLYNAVTLRSKINDILSQKNPTKGNHAFLLIDLDNYKQINDSFGHGYGDGVLKDVAQILNTRFRSSDIVGRLGGDEFVVLLCNIRSCEYVEYLADELCQSIHRTYKEGDKEVSLSASIGIAVAPDEGSTFEELYKKSDIAQYNIKRLGKNGFMRYQQN